MKKHTSPFIVIAVVILAVGLAFFAFQLLFIQPDSKKVACSELPSAEQVQNILTEHTDIIQELGRLGPENTIRFDADATRCPGKADIFIIYGTEKQRHQIKDRIGDNFFGIPYRMANM
ncbi:MAG: hypothetical protein WC734_05630 [Patescibacteria group bacterium]